MQSDKHNNKSNNSDPLKQEGIAGEQSNNFMTKVTKQFTKLIQIKEQKKSEKTQAYLDEEYIIHLKKGIKAKKFHYTRQSHKEITIKFVNNNAIQWSTRGNGDLNSKKGKIMLKNIEGIIFGAFSSTFWSYRPRILQMVARKQTNQIPFYAWNCISIKGKGRTIDLSIEDRKSMLSLIRVIQIEQNKNNLFEIQIPNDMKIMEESQKREKERRFRDPLFLYKLIAIKMKISYHSCTADVTIKELFLSAIIKTADMIMEIEAQEGKSVRSTGSVSNGECTQNRAKKSTFHTQATNKNESQQGQPPLSVRFNDQIEIAETSVRQSLKKSKTYRGSAFKKLENSNSQSPDHSANDQDSLRKQQTREVSQFNLNIKGSLDGKSEKLRVIKPESASPLNTVVVEHGDSQEPLFSGRSNAPLSDELKIPNFHVSQQTSHNMTSRSLTQRFKKRQSNFQNLDFARYKTLKKEQSKVINNDIYHTINQIFKNSETQERLFMAGLQGQKFKSSQRFKVLDNTHHRQLYRTKERQLYDLRMTERDLVESIKRIQFFLIFTRNLGNKTDYYSRCMLNLRLHQLIELNFFRKMIKGTELVIEKHFEIDVPSSFKFYDRDMLTAAKYIYCRKIVEAKKKVYAYQYYDINQDQGGEAMPPTTRLSMRNKNFSFGGSQRLSLANKSSDRASKSNKNLFSRIFSCISSKSRNQLETSRTEEAIKNLKKPQEEEEDLFKSYSRMKKVQCQTLYEHQARIALSKDEFLKIQDGTYLCDKNGRLYYNPKEGQVQLKLQVKFEMTRNKVLQVRQLHLLQAKNEFIVEIMNQDAAKEEEEEKKEQLTNKFLLGLQKKSGIKLSYKKQNPDFKLESTVENKRMLAEQWHQKRNEATKKALSVVTEKDFQKRQQKLEREIDKSQLYFTNFYEDIKPLFEVEKILREQVKQEDDLQKSIIKLSLNKNKTLSYKRMTSVFQQLLEASPAKNELLDDAAVKQQKAIRKAINSCQEKLKAAGANSHLFSGSTRVARAMMARAEAEGLVVKRRDSLSEYYKNDETYFGSMPSAGTEKVPIDQVSETRESHETDTPLPQKEKAEKCKQGRRRDTKVVKRGEEKKDKEQDYFEDSH